MLEPCEYELLTIRRYYYIVILILGTIMLVPDPSKTYSRKGPNWYLKKKRLNKKLQQCI